jgi:hypothetical protein
MVQAVGVCLILPMFNPRPVHKEFEMHKMELEQVLFFTGTSVSPVSIILPVLNTHSHLSTFCTMYSYQLTALLNKQSLT